MTIDLTKSVVNEALNKKVSFIIAYHPFIFRGLKSITLKDPQQESLLRLVQAGISVYCPHTSVDAAVGGVNDWLANGVTQGAGEIKPRKALVANKTPVPGHEEGGMGRLVELEKGMSMEQLVENVKKTVGMNQIQVAFARNCENSQENKQKAEIKTVAICAGSGGGVFKDSTYEADVYLTGEMSHHELLYMVETGKSVIVCGHSNTERGYLSVLKDYLAKQLKADYEGDSEVIVSETDTDPLEIV